MREYIAIYRASHIPRFYRDESIGQRLREAFLASSVLWSAALVHFVETLGMSIELRIATDGVSDVESDNFGKTSFFLLLGCSAEMTEAHRAAVKEFECLLPEGYAWRRLSKAEPEIFRPRKGWKVARLVRRVEFVDLPIVDARRSVSTPPLSNTSPAGVSSQTGSGNTSVPSSAAAASAPVISPSGPSATTIRQRILPGYDHRTISRELRRSVPCLPLLSKLALTGGVPHRLFHQLQGSAPVIISIAIHPIDKDSLRTDRIIATAWSQLLQGLVPTTTNMARAASVAGELATAADALRRFWLPESYLASVSIQIAAQDRMHSLGVALHLSSMFGGMKAFEVKPPSMSPDGRHPMEVDVKDLGRADADIPSPKDGSWGLARWMKERKDWAAKLLEVGVLVPDGGDDGRLDFLARLRHIYTLDEVEQLLALPVADEEGLAGTDTQLVSPFSSPQFRYDPVAATTENPQSYADLDRIRIGVLNTKAAQGNVSANADHDGEHWHSIKKKDLSKHALVVGSTGSGKTLTTLFLARELYRVRVPFMVIEPVKTEYFAKLAAKLNAGGDKAKARIRRFNFEGNPATKTKSKDFLPFDPMRLQAGVSVARHASYLKSCFQAAFPLTPPLALVLETGIRKYYTDSYKNGGCQLELFQTGGQTAHRVQKSVKISDGRVFPSLRTFRDYFCGTFLEQAFPGRGSSSDNLEARDLFRRRFENLTSGLIGQSSELADECLLTDQDNRRYDMFSLLLNAAADPRKCLNVIIELDGIPDAEEKALVMAFLMTFLFEYRQAQDLELRRKGLDGTSEGLKHVLIVEEAHRLLANSAAHGSRGGDWIAEDPRKRAVSLFTDMLAEVRTYGQGIVIVEQIPTKIIPEAVKNTNLRIMLRLTSKDDRDFLGDAMNFTEAQKLFVTGLTAEEGKDIRFVVFEENIDQPRLLKLPLPTRSRQKRGWLFDEHFGSSAGELTESDGVNPVVDPEKKENEQ